MKKVLIKILSVLFQLIDGLLCKLHIKRPTIVVFMDGGICAQMLMYLHGQYYADADFDIRYDINWYRVHGNDQNGCLSRKFELTEMWPEIEFKTLTKLQRKWYLLFFQVERKNGDFLPHPNEIEHSVYLNYYWNLSMEDTQILFAKIFKIQRAARFDKFDTNLASVVGVHVRRGDLAKGDNPYYGGVTDGYFLRAIDYCNQEFAPKKYFFFSDEPDWVEQNICNKIQQPYEIIRGNKAWEDLWLLAQCPIIVASQGSFGKFAARINRDAILIQCDNQYAIRDREKTYFIQ